MTRAYYVYWREMRRFWRQPTRVAVTMIQPALWLTLMGNSLNEATSRIPQIRLILGAPDFMTYMTAGVICMATLFSGVYSGMSVLWDRRIGYLDKMLASPIPRSAIPQGKMLAAAVQNALQLASLLVVARLFGVRVVTGWAGILVIAGLSTALSLCVSAASLALAARVRTQETFIALVSCLALPLIFTSTVVFPTALMPRWLAAAAIWNPLSYAVRPMRRLISYGWLWNELYASSATIAILAVLLGGLAALQFHRHP